MRGFLRCVAPASLLLACASLSVLCLVPACTRDTALPAAAGAAHPDGLPTVLSAIPFPADDAADRAAAALIPLTVPGDNEYRCSDGSYDEDTHHVLPAGLDQVQWAMYRLPTNGFPALSIEVELQRLIGDSYFGIANFAKGSWEFSNPLDTSHYTRGVNANLISPAGRVYIVIAAYNMSTTRVVSASLVVDQPGWVHSVVADYSARVNALELFKDGSGGQPRLAVLTERYLDYLSSGPYLPQDPAGWVAVRAVQFGAEFSLSPPLKATFVSGGPALAYTFDGNYWEVRYTYATMSSPGEEDWITTQVRGGESTRSMGLGLCEFQGTPRVIFETGTSTRSVVLAASPVAFPGTFDWVESTVAEGGLRPAIACINGALSCTYFNEAALARVKYARALTDEPSGPASWAVTNVSTDLQLDYRALTNLIADPIFGGEAPTVLYRGHGATFTAVDCARVLEPAAPGDWAHNTIVFPAQIAGSMMELKLIRNMPAVVYYLEEERCVQLAWGHNDPPDGPADWTIHTIATDVDVSAVTLEEYSSLAAVAYFDTGAMQIKYAYYEGDE